MCQEDFYGTEVYFDVRYVYIKPFKDVHVYPNPIVDEASISIYSNKDMTINIEVYTSLGHIQLALLKDVSEGDNNLTMELYDLPAGMYFFIVTNEIGELIEKKVIKK